MASVSAASGAMLVALVANILLLRTLPIDVAGRFAVLIALKEVIGLTANLGQSEMLLRLYSKQPDGAFDWPSDLRRGFLFSLPMSLAGMLLCRLLYDLSSFQMAYLLIASSSIVVISSLAMMFAAARKFALSNVLIRVPNSLLILPALAVLLSAGSLGLSFVLGAHLILYAAVIAAGVYGLRSSLERGREKIRWGDRFQGTVLFASSATLIVSNNGMTAIAGLLVPPIGVATYAALATLFRPFALVRHVLQQIFTRELAPQRQVPHRQLLLGTWSVAVLMGFAAVILAPSISHWVYSGRYDEGVRLLPWLALAGVFNLTEALPRGGMLARSPMRYLSRVSLVEFLLAPIGIVAGYGLTQRFGVLGTAWTVALLFSLRNLIHQVSWRQVRAARLEASS